MYEKVEKLSINIRLVEYLFNSKKADVNYCIARVMITKVPEFPNVSIEEIAYLAHTSPSSVTRFCRSMGYSSFKELRTDTTKYQFANIFHDMQGIAKTKGLDAALNYYIRENKKKQEEMFDIFEHSQVKRIAEKLKNVKRAAVLSGLHGFTAANSFAELATYYGITVFEVNREAEVSMIQSILESEDIIFIISLSGKWLKEKVPLLNITPEISEKIVVISYADISEYSNMCVEIVSVKELDEFFSWNFYSSHTVQMFFLIVVTYLSALT